MEYRCVECGFRVKALFVQYSPGNIRLIKCENCKSAVDEYVECELMIVVIDLILHKPKAFRHLLYNVLNQETLNVKSLFLKSVVGFLLLDAYRSLLVRISDQESGLSDSFSTLVDAAVKVLLDVFVGNFIFLGTLVLAMRIFINTSICLSSLVSMVIVIVFAFIGLEEPLKIGKLRYIFLAILISSYFKIFLISMMVWEFPISVIFIIDVLVLSSNTMALKVMTESAMNLCILICLTAHAAKLLITQAPDFRYLQYI